MKNNAADLNKHLHDLNALLVKERHAITHLNMNQLDEIQQKKSHMLSVLHQAEHAIDEESTTMIKNIKVNNDRNRILLESGLKLIARLQENVFRRLALTYAAHGRSLNIGSGPRLLNRSA